MFGLLSLRVSDSCAAVPPAASWLPSVTRPRGRNPICLHISFVVEPKAGLPMGTEIRNVALIQFDRGEIIATNQVDPHDPSQGTDPDKECLITIDADPPTSAVEALPPVGSDKDFSVSWSGADIGAGVASYDIYVATDGVSYELWLERTTETAATFNGPPGHTYAFYSVARDNVGHVEAAPATADAETVIPPNEAPIAADDMYEMYGTILTIVAPGVLDNDSDTESDPLTAVLVDGPSEGTVTLNTDGSFAYVAGLDFNGTDSFTYKANDGSADSNTATATITDMLMVTNLNDRGEGSLRWTMANANAHPGPDTIRFAVAGTISVGSALPALDDGTGGTRIDGTSAPGYSGVPLVVLMGPGAGSGVRGIDIRSANNDVHGLQISGFGRGINISGSDATGNAIAGNYIGNDGHMPMANQIGIMIESNASNNRSGTDGDGVNDALERNVISGNNGQGVYLGWVTGALVRGNYIGTGATGTVAVPNEYGIDISGGSGNQIGGADAGLGNVISGNTEDGLRLIETTGTIVQGNLIGTSATGTIALANGDCGIEVVMASGNMIGGTTGEARNIISGNGNSGIYIYGVTGWDTTDNVIQGNFIGTDITGTAPLGNWGEGILIWPGCGNRIGGTTPGAGNVISGNGDRGVLITGIPNLGVYSDENVLEGNRIGIDVTGSQPLGNGDDGVFVATGDNNTLGGMTPDAGNTIAFNAGAGVNVYRLGTGNAIQSNTIFSNAGLGIELEGNGVTPNDVGDPDTGPNNLQDFPEIAEATFDGVNTTISGTLSSVAGADFTIEVYSNAVGDPSGYGEGQVYLGATTCWTDGSGNGTWLMTVSGDVTGLVLAATATNLDGNTSECSAPAPANTAPLAVGDTTSTPEDTLVNVNVLANDTDGEGDPLVITILTSANGVAVVNDGSTPTDPTDDTVDFIPADDFHGPAEFTYKVNDGELDSNEATVVVTIEPVNDAPRLAGIPDMAFAGDGSDSHIDLDDYYSDVETAAADATFTVVSSFVGVTTDIDPGSHVLTITGDADFNGEGNIIIGVIDTGDGTSAALSDEDTLRVVVSPVNDAPKVAIDTGSVAVAEGQTAQNTGTFADVDLDDSVIITASIGAITQNNGNHGTWSWSYVTTDGPDQSQTVILTATDGAGDSSTTEFEMIVNNVAPGVEAGEDAAADEGSEVVFVGSFADPGSTDTHTIVWDSGDGGTVGGTSTPSHAYGDNGTYTVTLTVTDDDGGIGTDLLTVTANNVAAGLDQSVNEGDLVGIAPVFTDAGGADTHTATLDWGDGTEITTIDPATSPLATSHTYADSGAYIVTVTLTDDDGASTSDTLMVTVVSGAHPVDLLDSYIQNLPGEAFKSPAAQRQNAFHNKLIEVKLMMERGDYQGAMNKLTNDIRAKADGSMGGKANDDWIIDPLAQYELCNMVDDLRVYLSRLLSGSFRANAKSDGEHLQEVLFIPAGP